LYPESEEILGLAEPFTQEELHKAVRGLALNKASSLDGLPAKFAQVNWEILASDLMKILHDFYHLKADLTPMNKAHILLISKGDNVTDVKDYRPISVINLIPKIHPLQNLSK
jgi:hypothetical protein